MSIPNEVFITFSFIGFLLCCIPFPWHLEAWNTGTCLYMAWAGLGCLNVFINAVVWNGNAINWAPVWCDISARFIVGLSIGIPCASLCINRRLYHIASVRSVTTTKAEKRRAIMVDLAIGLGIPILVMILQYIPQGHRFNIFEDLGCVPSTYVTPVAIALVYVPPVIVGCVSAVYCVLSIRAFLKSRRQFKQLLSGSKNLSTGRYTRLMMLAGIDTALTVPLGIFAIYENTSVAGVSPWKGWADTHWGFSRVEQIPALIWRARPDLETSLELTRFFTILCAFIFFAFFGFADEARKNYRSAVTSVAKRVGVSTGSSGFGLFSSTGSKTKGSDMTSTGRGATLPVFVERHTVRKHDELDSISDMSVSIADVGGFLDEKNEKPQSLTVQVSYDGMGLSDVGGTLADYSDSPYSPTPSSGASSASSIAEPTAAVTRPDSNCIEISSVRHLDVGECPDALSIPEPTHDASAAPRHLSDASPV
ncbi:putative pheromone receptor [Lyophyllum shimeji]|uniref:Pheromone receptor n=1 Tax=Lyophyllum shimeji TaxID=47721 RepID=A0A9P3UTL9_LYOSH|nr:putative pheromone receptor [Lyophyllum shimeji]